MRHQRRKDLYLSVLRRLAYLNHGVWTLRTRWFDGGPQKGEDPLWLNLASGPKTHPDFVDLEVNPLRDKDMWLDVRNGLPFPDGSVDGIYSGFFFEHLYPDELEAVLAECCRILAPDGGLRVLVPSLIESIEAYQAGDRERFPDFPRDWETIGGRFSNYIFCAGQHRMAFDADFMRELLTRAGFNEVQEGDRLESEVFPREALVDLESDKERMELTLEIEAWPAERPDE